MKYLLTTITLVGLIITTLAQSPKIEFEAPQVYPEGIAYNSKTKLFYVSSVITGSIASVDAQGNYKVIYSDSTLRSSFGMKVDSKRNKLWICTADPNYSKYSTPETFKIASKVIALDLNTHKLVTSVDLSKLYKGQHFANDLTLDDKGNLYVTDSFSPVIYKIDAKEKATILVENELFKSKDVGLNGIAYHPDGYLLAVNNGNGTILKIDVNTKQVSKVKLDQFFPGADGVLLDQKQNLTLIQNKGVNRAFKLTSTDGWLTAKVSGITDVAARFQNPTTATTGDTQQYLLNSKMNELSDSTRNPSPAYSIQAITLVPTP